MSLILVLLLLKVALLDDLARGQDFALDLCRLQPLVAHLWASNPDRYIAGDLAQVLDLAARLPALREDVLHLLVIGQLPHRSGLTRRTPLAHETTGRQRTGRQSEATISRSLAGR